MQVQIQWRYQSLVACCAMAAVLWTMTYNNVTNERRDDRQSASMVNHTSVSDTTIWPVTSFIGCVVHAELTLDSSWLLLTGINGNLHCRTNAHMTSHRQWTTLWICRTHWLNLLMMAYYSNILLMRAKQQCKRLQNKLGIGKTFNKNCPKTFENIYVHFVLAHTAQ